MLEHYSHIRMAAKRTALDAIATPLPASAHGNVPIPEGDVHQIGNQIEKPRNDVVRKLLN